MMTYQINISILSAITIDFCLVVQGTNYNISLVVANIFFIVLSKGMKKKIRKEDKATIYLSPKSVPLDTHTRSA